MMNVNREFDKLVECKYTEVAVNISKFQEKDTFKGLLMLIVSFDWSAIGKYQFGDCVINLKIAIDFGQLEIRFSACVALVLLQLIVPI